MRRQNLKLVTGLALAAGAVWLVIEFLLRQERLDLTLDTGLMATLVVVGSGIGLAIRPRVTAAGDRTVNSELTSLGVLAVSLLPAGMLGLLALALLASVLVNTLAWIVWALVVVFAFLVQLLVYALAVAALLGSMALASEADEAAPAAFGCSLVLFAGAVGAIVIGIGGIVGLDFEEMWDLSIVNVAIEWRIAPGWTIFVGKLERAIEGLDHNLVVSLLASAVLGLFFALLAALGLRKARQAAMTNVNLRGYLPVAAAPLPDDVPALTDSMLTPTFVYLLIGWIGYMFVRVIV